MKHAGMAFDAFTALLAARCLRRQRSTGRSGHAVVRSAEARWEVPRAWQPGLSVKIDGKNAKVTKWAPFVSQRPGGTGGLIDSSGAAAWTQMDDIASCQEPAAECKAAIGYMRTDRRRSRRSPET